MGTSARSRPRLALAAGGAGGGGFDGNDGLRTAFSLLALSRPELVELIRQECEADPVDAGGDLNARPSNSE